MPLYEYQCPKCGNFELIQKFSDEPLTECPTCGKPVQKLLSAPAIQFKGTGWYVTDYARKPDGKGKAESGKSESAKTEGTKSGEDSAGQAKSSAGGSSGPKDSGGSAKS